MPRDYLSTLRQTIPQFRRVVNNLRPTYRLPDASHVTAEFLEREGIEVLVWDVDGTLMAYHALDVDPAFRDRIRSLFQTGPTRHAILSNCDEHRFNELKGIFPEVPLYRGYDTGNGPVLRVSMGSSDSHTGEEVGQLMADQGRQIRKPRGALLQMIAAAVGAAPANVGMIGDQYFTDIATANLAGARSIKVPTLRRETFPASLRASQALEALVFRLRNGRA